MYRHEMKNRYRTTKLLEERNLIQKNILYILWDCKGINDKPLKVNETIDSKKCCAQFKNLKTII